MCPSIGRIDKEVVSGIVEYYSSTRKKKILTFVTTWMDLEVIMLSGIVCYHFKNPNSVIYIEAEERIVVTKD